MILFSSTSIPLHRWNWLSQCLYSCSPWFQSATRYTSSILISSFTKAPCIWTLSTLLYQHIDYSFLIYLKECLHMSYCILNLLDRCKHLYKLTTCKFCIYTHPVNSKSHVRHEEACKKNDYECPSMDGKEFCWGAGTGTSLLEMYMHDWWPS